jgi:hypothetical protein
VMESVGTPSGAWAATAPAGPAEGRAPGTA